MIQNQEELIEQAKVEARAKIIWGDKPKQVIFFLRARGVSLEEAIEITDAAFAERTAEIRAAAVKKIITGLCLLVLPYFGNLLLSAFGTMSLLSMLVFGLTCAAALFGLYLAVSGFITVFFPKTEELDEEDSL